MTFKQELDFGEALIRVLSNKGSLKIGSKHFMGIVWIP